MDLQLDLQQPIHKLLKLLKLMLRISIAPSKRVFMARRKIKRHNKMRIFELKTLDAIETDFTLLVFFYIKETFREDFGYQTFLCSGAFVLDKPMQLFSHILQTVHFLVVFP